MEKLIGVVNEIQDKFTLLNIECPINLPQIAVVGEQSAGKSSVLENFVGRDFLPRGSGIVTRRPLILQLINKAGAEYAVFVHKPNVQYTDFSEVCREIEIETDRVTGKNKNVSPIPINLRVYSPDVLNLTLIDLPGLTKVPVGDQPPDIEIQIKNMIQGFISNPNCLILVVVPAIIDLANSDALKLAREIDPSKMRTIGVITKIDMMGEGTDCIDVLNNKVYNLSRGFVGIVNRSQKDIVGKKDIISAKNAEMAFFRGHPKYRGIIDRLGTQYLQKTLSLQLSHHIKETLPEVRQRIIEQLAEVKREIEKNPDLFQDWSNTGATASKILMLKIQALSKKINTALGYEIENIDLEKKSKGTVISQILCETFYDEIEKCKPTPEEMRSGIHIAIMNTQGVRQSLMSASGSFTSATKQFIRFIDQPCLKIVSMVAGVTCEMVEEIVAEVFTSYPDLRTEVSDFLRRKVADSSQTAQSFLRFFLLAQADHINTNHPDFLAAQSPRRSENKTANTQGVTGMENIIHRQGPLSFSGQSLMKSNKEYFFVLRGQSLLIYKDSMKRELKEQAFLAECLVKETSSRGKLQLLIFRKDTVNITKNQKNLEIIFPNREELECWKEAFINAGLEHDRADDATQDVKSIDNNVDTELIKNIQYIYLLVNSYINITIKGLQDIVAKVIVSAIIVNLRNVVLTDLVVHLYSQGDIEGFLRESSEADETREKIVAMRDTCNSALEVINSFMGSSDLSLPSTFKNIPKLPNFPNNTIQNYPQLQKPPTKHPSATSMQGKARSDSNLAPNPNTHNDLPPLKCPPSVAPKLLVPEIKKPKRPPTFDKTTRFYDASSQ